MVSRNLKQRNEPERVGGEVAAVDGSNPVAAAGGGGRSWWLLTELVLLFELVCGVGLSAVTFWFVFTFSSTLLSVGISFVATAVLYSVWIAVTLFAAWRSKARWTVASALTIQLLLGFAAVQLVLGIMPGFEWFGVTLLLVAIVGFVACVFLKRREAADVRQADRSPLADG